MNQYINIRPTKSGLFDIGECIYCHAKGIPVTSNHKCKPMETEDTLILEKDNSDLALCSSYVRTASNAKKRNIEFSLSFTKYKKLSRTKYCYYTGILLDSSNANNDNYPTLERLDSTKGYVDDNVVIVCKRINHIKSNISIQDIKDIYDGLRRKSLL